MTLAQGDANEQSQRSRAWLARPWLEALVLFAVLLFALALRLYYWHRVEAMFNDGPLFLTIAQEIAQRDWSSALRHPYHPLYPFVVAVTQLGVEDWESAAVAVSIAGGVAAVFFLYWFLRFAFRPGVALLGAALLAVHPYAVYFSADVLSDGLYMAFFLAAAAALWSALERRSAALAAWGGLAAGLAYLTRPEGLGLVAAAGATAGLLWLRRQWSFGRAAGWGLALVAGSLFTLIPYVSAIRIETGGWQLTQKKSIQELSGVKLPERLKDMTRPKLRHQIEVEKVSFDHYESPEWSDAGAHWEALREIAKTTKSSFRPELLLLLLIGLWSLRGRPGTRGSFVLLVILTYFAAVYLLRFQSGYVSRRHVLVPMLLTLGYSAVGVEVLASAFARWGRRWVQGAPVWLPRATSALVVLALCALSVGKVLRAGDVLHTARRHAAEWLHAEGERGALVAASKRRDAYYAGGDFVPLRAASAGGFLAYLHEHRVRYVIAQADKYPGLAEAEARQELRLLHREQAGKTWVGVYEVVAPESLPSVSAGERKE